MHQCMNDILPLRLVKMELYLLHLVSRFGPVAPSLGVRASLNGHKINLRSRWMINGRGKNKKERNMDNFPFFTLGLRQIF